MKTKKLKSLLSQLKDKLQVTEKFFLNSTAKAVGFVQRRSSKLTGWDFFQLMTIEHFNEAAISLEGLTDVLKSINQKADISAQALNQRMNSEKAVLFMKEVFETVYKKHLSPVIDKISISTLDSFNRVFLQDSTQMELNEQLAGEFKGSGGSASKAAMKIDLVYEVKRSILEKMIISEGTIPDQKRADIIMDFIQKGDLFIRDLGYFVIDVFRNIAEKGAYYLSRYKHGTKIYLSQEKGAESANLLTLIQKNIAANTMDIAIFFRRAETSLPHDCLSVSSGSHRISSACSKEGCTKERQRSERGKIGTSGIQHLHYKCSI